MIRLLKIEYQKLFYNRSFWVMLGLYVVLLAPIAFSFDSLITSVEVNVNGQESSNLAAMLLAGFTVFDFPGIWKNMAYLGSWFKLLLALIIVIVVTNEYTYKTLRQNIIDGMSKWEVIWAKQFVIFTLGIISTLVLIVLTMILGVPKENVSLFEGSGILIAYFASLLLYLNLAYLFATWLKKAGMAIGVLFLYTLVIENLISFKIPDHINKFFPMNLIDNMVPNPLGKLIGQSGLSDFSLVNIMACICYISLFIVLNYWLLKKGHAAA